jgi:hypothetical protein
MLLGGMSTTRKSRSIAIAALALALALSLAACGSTSSARAVGPTPGVVTGLAIPCSGLAADVAIPDVTVRLYSGRTLRASQTVAGGTAYRFSVPPGPYDVTSWWGSDAVVVRPGRVVTLHPVVNTCL